MRAFGEDVHLGGDAGLDERLIEDDGVEDGTVLSVVVA